MTKKTESKFDNQPGSLFLQRRNLYRFLFHFCILTIFVIGLPLFAILGEASDAPPPPPFKDPVRFINKSDFVIYWALIGSTLVPFYAVLSYVLIPRYLVARKYRKYGMSVAALFIAGIALLKYVEYLLQTKGAIVNEIPVPAQLLPMTLLLAVSTAFEMIVNWEYQKRTQETIEKEKISAELSFLKSQINPHFLFNTLNNIYSLAERKSDKTGQSILLLSNLMRYILYDTRDGKIMLKNEIKHLEEYIELQRMRIVEVSNVFISFENAVKNDRILIEPLMFIPFVENAFKHGISYTSRSFINMNLSLNESILKFKISNSKRQVNGMKADHLQSHGVGIVNTRRRLDLLYRDRHDLKITDEFDSYTVELILKLDPKKDFI
jgi:two-component system, LytTR family, sensor kinase